METKQVTHLHSLMLILLFIDKSFSNGWGQTTRREEEGLAVTAELPSVCPWSAWSAFIYFIAVYIMLCQNQSGEEGGARPEGGGNPGRNLAHEDREQQQRTPDLIHYLASPSSGCLVLVKYKIDINGCSPSLLPFPSL